MAPQNRLISLMTVIFLICRPGEAVANDDSNNKARCVPNKGTKLLAKDVIKLSISEIRDMRKFVNSIPRLKSVMERDRQSPSSSTELLKCVVGLIDGLSDARSILNRLRHFKSDFMRSDSESLRSMANRILGFKHFCHCATKNVDRVVLMFLDRKLADVALLINDVVSLVSRMEVESAA